MKKTVNSENVLPVLSGTWNEIEAARVMPGKYYFRCFPMLVNCTQYFLSLLSCSASNIASIYRKRWQIELFFKTIKQNLKIKRFYGMSENAVRTQIWIAMIVYILYMMLKKLSGCVTKCFTHFISKLSVGLFKHCELFKWVIGSPPERCTDKSMPLFQMELGL